MATQKGMSDYTLTLDGVNAQSINAPGDFVHVQSVSVGGTAVSIQPDDGKAIVRQEGQGNRLYYSRLTVSTPVACVVTLQAGYGYATDGRASVSATINAPVDPAVSNPAVAAVTVTAGNQVQLIGADGDTVGVLLGVDSTQPNGVWIGDNTAAADMGLFVEPGQTLPVPTSAALYAFNDGGSDVKVSVLQLKSA